MSDANQDIESGDFDPNVSEYQPLTDAEIADFAKKIYRNEIFVSWMVCKGDMHLLTSIFMPLLFIDDITRRGMIRDGIQHFWAPMSEAGPMGVNGYPMFFSFGMWNQSDAGRIHTKLKEISTLLGDD